MSGFSPANLGHQRAGLPRGRGAVSLLSHSRVFPVSGLAPAGEGQPDLSPSVDNDLWLSAVLRCYLPDLGEAHGEAHGEPLWTAATGRARPWEEFASLLPLRCHERGGPVHVTRGSWSDGVRASRLVRACSRSGVPSRWPQRDSLAVTPIWCRAARRNTRGQARNPPLLRSPEEQRERERLGRGAGEGSGGRGPGGGASARDSAAGTRDIQPEISSQMCSRLSPHPVGCP